MLNENKKNIILTFQDWEPNIPNIDAIFDKVRSLDRALSDIYEFSISVDYETNSFYSDYDKEYIFAYIEKVDVVDVKSATKHFCDIGALAKLEKNIEDILQNVLVDKVEEIENAYN